MTSRGWQPGFGDNDFLGWLITATYFIVIGLCIWALHVEFRLNRREGERQKPMFWLALSALLLLLGINKQLDIQCWVEASGNGTTAAGWKAHHPWLFRSTLLLMLGLSGVTCLMALKRYVERFWRRYLLALVGLLYLGTFVLLRAAHSVPILHDINRNYYDAIHIVLELGSILMIGASAARAVGREERRLMNSAPETPSLPLQMLPAPAARRAA